jgi:hypothetical protein
MISTKSVIVINVHGFNTTFSEYHTGFESSRSAKYSLDASAEADAGGFGNSCT